MKQLSTYINEKLVLNKNTFKRKLKYFPKTRDELRNIIKQLLNERNDDGIIDLNDIDTSEITDMSGLFCENGIMNGIININISSWNVSKVRDMSGMFWGCRNLESIGDLSDWDVSSVRDMYSMFYNCVNLKSIGDISGWNVFNVRDVNCMFFNCKNLENIGTLKWDVSKFKNISSMFYNCGIKNKPKWYKE